MHGRRKLNSQECVEKFGAIVFYLKKTEVISLQQVRKSTFWGMYLIISLTKNM